MKRILLFLGGEGRSSHCGYVVQSPVMKAIIDLGMNVATYA